MSISISFRDIRLIKRLSKYSEEELLSPTLDKLINGYLETLGFDTTKAIVYVPSKHRCMQNNVAIGYRVVGELNSNRNSPMYKSLTSYERAAAYANTDLSMAQELLAMTGRAIDYNEFCEADNHELDGSEDFYQSLMEADQAQVASVIQYMEKLRDDIRGSMFNDAGALKVPSEYQQVKSK